MLDIILDKGKGSVLGKLWTMQLIEADLKLLIRIFVRNRNKGSIKKDYRFSKFNFSLRKYYFINKALLEKRLIYDSSIWIKLLSIHIIIDLATY